MPFTVATPVNTQNDRVYAQARKKRDVSSTRLIRERQHFSRNVWFRSPYQKWESRAFSSLSQVRRGTVNIIVGTFLVMVFYLTYVQYANTTLGPYSRTALHHTPLRTLWSICDVRKFLSLSLTCGPQTART